MQERAQIYISLFLNLNLVIFLACLSVSFFCMLFNTFAIFCVHSNIIRLLALLHFRHQSSPTTSPLSTTRRVGTIKLKDSRRKLSESQQRPRQKNLQLIISTWAPLCCTKVCFYLRIYRHRSVLHNNFSQ